MIPATGTSEIVQTAQSSGDPPLLARVVDAVHAAGERLMAVFSAASRPADRADMFAAAKRNEEVSLAGLQEALAAIRPQARLVNDEQETTALPPGEWWTLDAVEGNVNHVHGLPEWCVTVALLRDNAPVLTAVYQPIGNLTYTAVRGAGAHLNGARLQTSAKTELDAAIVTTSQSTAEQDRTYPRIGESIVAMLRRALLVRATVPCTFPLLLVATGQFDLFWQYEPLLSEVAAGVLLATEAGGVVSDTHGGPWQPGGGDILIAAPGVHAAAVQVLSDIS